MKRLFFRVAAAVVLIGVSSAPGTAQLVVVGPGYVKAPFVRVYSYPDGSSYVRAPFVGIYSPGHAFYPGYAPDGLVPTSDESPEQRLRRELVVSARNLHRSLVRFNTGAHWQEYLALPKEIMQPERARESDPAVRELMEPEKLEEALTRFNLVRNTHEYRMIAGLPEFAATHELLAAYLDRIGNASEHPQEAPIEELPAPDPEPK